MQITDVREILYRSNIDAGKIELYKNNTNLKTYLINGKYVFKVSVSPIAEQAKLNAVRPLKHVPEIHSSGLFAVSGCEYYYMIIDYLQGDDLWSVAWSLTDKEKYSIGKEIAEFLSKLQLITDDYYDMGHYIPTIPRFAKSWKEGHLEYARVLKNRISEINLDKNSQKNISKAFGYINANIWALEYQKGAGLLHNDFHPKNIIIHEGMFAGVIDWECSQYGEADFELSRLFDWYVYPEAYLFQENNLEILLKSIIENLQILSTIPHIEKRMTIYQLEHEVNQLIWHGKKQEKERINRIKGWLNGKVNDFLKII